MIILPDLPYPHDALTPAISEATMRAHHDRHHARYVEVTNTLLAETSSPGETLEEIVTKAWLRSARKLFNNAAQALNHGFFWASMTPEPQTVSGELSGALERAFDGDARKQFIAEGLGHFGAGWVWLAADHGRLTILSTHDADTVMRMPGLTPLLVCDLWEHAYYLDRQSDRAGYLEAWWDKLANWRFAEAQYEASLGRAAPWAYPKERAATPLPATAAGGG